MSGSPITASAEHTVREALEHARNHDVHHLPVLDDAHLVGLVCTCDLRSARPTSLIRDVMNAPAVTLDAESDAQRAAVVMGERGVGSVVVVHEGRPVGIITRGDLLEFWPSSEKLLVNGRCECCGLTQHLRTNEHDRTLCVYCKERARPSDWFDIGGGD